MFIFVKTIDKELNRIKDFLKKKQFFLYWTPNRYQSKTCVEHIEQVIDKSLINCTNSSMNLLYFLHMRVICFKYCKKVYEKSNQENFNFFGRIYGHVKFIILPHSNICVLDSELPSKRNIESRRLLLTLLFHEQGRSSLRRFSTHASLLE